MPTLEIMINKILYIDIETNKNGKIKDVGALFNGQELHESQLIKIEKWIRQAEYICGHNIIAHDIPFLEKVLGRPATEAELKEIKGGPGVDSSGKKITHNLAIGKGGGLKKQNEAVTKQILASLETTYKRSVFGHFVTDAKTLFHAIDRDTSGAVDKELEVAWSRAPGRTTEGDRPD